MTSNYYWVKVDHRYVWEIGYLMDGDWLLPGVEGKWYPVEIGPPVADISQGNYISKGTKPSKKEVFVWRAGL